MRAPFSWLLLLAACGRTEAGWPPPVEALEPKPIEPFIAPTPLAERSARFAGLWQVDQPYHGGYEASFYLLSANGDVRLVDSYGLPVPLPPGYQTGVVAPSLTSSLRCEFGTRWRSVNGDRLFISATCNDGVPRDIELFFESPAEQNAKPEGAVVHLVTVGNEPGWVHPDFEWRFKKCPPGAMRAPSGQCEG